MIKVNAPSRLHLGVIAPAEVDGRRYGSVGLALNVYETEVLAEKYDKIEVFGCRDAKRFARKIAEHFNIDGFRIKVMKLAPRHVGLGSTTQLALSIAKAILDLYDVKHDIVEVSRILGRGKVSGVGTYVFKYGGLVTDGGVGSFPPLLTRCEFPENWKVFVVIPKGKGLHGREEDRAFKILKPKSHLTYKASYFVFMKLIPSVMERKFEEFVRSLEKLQEIVGTMFSEVQGDVFNPKSAEAIDVMRSLGLRGIGQSSWGPTVYGFACERFEEILDDLKANLSAEVLLASARNEGAKAKSFSDLLSHRK